MAYLPDTPAGPSEDPSQSQPKITANFQAINTYVSVNHVDFNDPNEGKHKFMQMPEQASAPTTALNEGALYTKDVSGATQLFYRQESNGNELQLTGDASLASNGYVVLPGGIRMQWGTQSVTENTVVTFPIAFSTSLYNVQVTVQSNQGTRICEVKAGTLSNFTTSTNGNTFPIYWMALGV